MRTKRFMCIFFVVIVFFAFSFGNIKRFFAIVTSLLPEYSLAAFESIPESTTTNTISGYVVPEFSYAPDKQSLIKSGFKVHLIGTGLYALTDNEGYFQIKNVPVTLGTGKLKISRESYLAREFIINTSVSQILIRAGDVVQDGAINFIDIMEVAKVFNHTYGQEGFDVNLDFNRDDAINLADIIIMALHFNNTSESYETNNGESKKILSGSFVQPYLIGSWTKENFLEEYDYMKSVGMDHIIIQWTVDSKNKKTYYPSKMEEFTQDGLNDAVGTALETAKQKNLKVWLGLNTDDDWWINYAKDREWLASTFDVGKKAASELWELYKDQYKDTIAGFYIVMEVDNLNFMDNESIENMKCVYKDTVDFVHEYINKPVMVAPFFNESVGQDAVDYAATWKDILSYAPIDIIALQDSIGVGHCTVSTVGKWFFEMKKAIFAARPETELWSDLEIFDTSWQPAPVKRVIDQINAEYKYVTKITSFSFNHYYSPNQVSSIKYNEFRKYIESIPK